MPFAAPFLPISRLQCQLFGGLLVFVASSFYQFLSLFVGEDVVHVGDVLALQKPLAKPEDRQDGSGCLFPRREGGDIVRPKSTI